MGGVALQGRVQHADVEPAGHGFGVVHGQVLGGGGLLEAASVQCHLQFRDGEGGGLVGWKAVHIGRQYQLARHLALGIVVAQQQVDGDARGIQASHLPGKVDAGVEVLPVAVVQVAGNDHEVHLLRDGLGDQVVEGITCCCAEQLRRGILVGGQSRQRAVEVDVGGVDESHFKPC